MSKKMLKCLKLNAVMSTMGIAFAIMQEIFQAYGMVVLYDWSHVMLYVLIIVGGSAVIYGGLYDVVLELKRKWHFFMLKMERRFNVRQEV